MTLRTPLDLPAWPALWISLSLVACERKPPTSDQPVDTPSTTDTAEEDTDTQTSETSEDTDASDDTGATGSTGSTADTATTTGTTAETGDTAGTPTPGDGGLRLATWNVSLLDEEGEGDNPRTAADLALLASYVDQLAADVVALQEVRGVTGTETIFPAADWHAECELRNSAQNVCVVLREDSGWTMTRNADVVELNASDPNLRQGLDLTLTMPGREPLRILAVHLKFGCLAGETATDCGVLFDQFDVVEDWIDARVAAGEAHVVLGDFNRFLTADDSVWLDLDDGDPAGADLIRSIPQGTPTPCWSGVFTEFIDHIVLDPTSASWMQASDQLVYAETDFYAYYERLSDHCPLWVDLEVP